MGPRMTTTTQDRNRSTNILRKVGKYRRGQVSQIPDTRIRAVKHVQQPSTTQSTAERSSSGGIALPLFTELSVVGGSVQCQSIRVSGTEEETDALGRVSE